MKVTLVIPVRNEEQSLDTLLDSISCQTRPPDEIILVDGGSTDRTVELARTRTHGDDRFHIVEAGPATPGRGRNVGILAAGCEWIALTDAGIRLEPTWLEHLMGVVVEDPNVDVVYGNYEPIISSRFERAAALAYVLPKQPVPGGQMRGRFIASSLLRKTVWDAVGGFPDLRAAEDLIFMEKVEAQGFRIGWAPEANVWWQLRPNLLETFRKFVLYSKHNVWANRQRYWHYGIARQYLLALPFVGLALWHSPWWLAVPGVALVARVAKRIWQRREGRGLCWLLSPVQFLEVGLVLLTIDVATFVGWFQALCTRAPRQDAVPRLEQPAVEVPTAE